VKTVLAPVDFSPVTDSVVNEAAILGRALNGRVVVLTVIQPPVILHEYAALVQNIGEITAAGEKAAAQKLSVIQDKLQSQGLATETVQLVGSPVHHITAEAERLQADHIVMGSHGHTALYDLLVGSTTHGVLMRAKCPVTILPSVGHNTKKKAA
jgi:nucleotide-binding universal stress UspA family protein